MTSLFDSIVAGLGLVVCVAMLLRFALPPGRRNRVDARARRMWDTLRSLPARLRGDARVQRQVKRQADEAIARARRKARAASTADRNANVIRPDAFKSRPPRDKLH